MRRSRCTNRLYRPSPPLQLPPGGSAVEGPITSVIGMSDRLARRTATQEHPATGRASVGGGVKQRRPSLCQSEGIRAAVPNHMREPGGGGPSCSECPRWILLRVRHGRNWPGSRWRPGPREEGLEAVDVDRQPAAHPKRQRTARRKSR